MSLNDTPRANRLHIAIFGKRNAGKSSLINALTGQDVALVSDHPGTTTDPVFKSMELHPIGPVVFIDTAGFDDEGDLGSMRIARTKDIVKKTDVAIILIASDDLEEEKEWIGLLKKAEIPTICVINKTDCLEEQDFIEQQIKIHFDIKPIRVSALLKEGLTSLRDAIEGAISEEFKREKILGEMVKPQDVVLLVMPQDIQAPKGRLILPQAQTIRELLDNRCTTVCTTVEDLDHSLKALRKAPDLIITDSQCFYQVYEKKPRNSGLTSFSVLFAAYKGDIKTFIKGAKAIGGLTKDSRILIAEACTHAPLVEDIGREKIPSMLREKFGQEMEIDIVSGSDFPEDLSGYDLIIHCGACMFNRRHVLCRVAAAKKAGISMSNYGIVMAKMTGILDKIRVPADF